MSKTLSSNQSQKIDGPDVYPIYLAHIFLPGETLYMSDRNFKYNGHDYEAYLHNLPDLANQIERFGGYLNFNGRLKFRNSRFRAYDYLSQFFDANPITRREMELYVLYHKTGEAYGSDVSTKLLRAAFGQLIEESKINFSYELFSILHTLDSKKLFTQINRQNWPNADPKAIGQLENRLIGAVRGIPCPCVDTGAASTLYANLGATATEIYLSDIENPMSFPQSGTIQVDEEKMTHTGKDQANKKLTGLTRGVSSTLGIEHKSGSVVWVIQSSYKYLAAGHQMKLIADVYVSGTRLPAADYTVNLNDGGKTTIALTRKALNKHGHGQKSLYQMDPSTAAHETITGSIVWWSGTGSAVDGYLKDKDQDTEVHFGYTGVIPEQKTGDFIYNFPAYNGDMPDSIYVCAVVDADLISVNGDYFRLNSPEQINIGDTGGKQTLRIKLTTTTVPTQIRFRGNAQPVGAGGNCVIIVYEAWMEIERWSVNPSGSPGEVLAPVVTIDGEGYKDDGSGTYTGTPNALIENPSDVRKYILMALLGRTAADIGASFGDMRTTYNGRSTPYKLAMNLPKIGLKASEIIKRLDEQTRSQMREDGGKFELNFHPGPNGAYGADFLPSDGTGITASGYWGSNTPNKSCDNSNATIWNGQTGIFPEWVQHDAGAGITKINRKLTIKAEQYATSGNYRVKNFVLSGSNNGTTWTTLYAGQQANNGNVQTHTFFNLTPYRYHRLTVDDNWIGAGDNVGVIEWELMEINWSAPSDPTMKVFDSAGSTFNRGDFTATNAFFWSSLNLSPYAGTDLGSTPYYIEVLDGAGKKATGYIGAVGAGETLGAETITGWTSFGDPFDFETFTSSGKDITSAIETDSTGAAYSNLTAYQVYSLLKLTANATITSGAPQFYFRDYDGVFTELSPFNAGLNTYYQNVPTGYDSIQINAAFPANFSCVFSVKKVTDPPSTAVHIFSSLNGTTRNWASIESGFDPNNIVSWEISAPVMTIDKTIFIGEPIFKMTPSVEIKNVLRAVYDLDHGGNGDRKKFGDYFGQIEIPDSTSITKYGELPEEITFPAIRNVEIVEDVLQWQLTQKKDVIWEVDLTCKWFVRKLERSDYFLLRHELHDNTLWRVLEIGEAPGKQQFRLHAIQYIGS